MARALFALVVAGLLLSVPGIASAYSPPVNLFPPGSDDDSGVFLAMNPSGEYVMATGSRFDDPIRVLAGNAERLLPAPINVIGTTSFGASAAISQDGAKVIAWFDPDRSDNSPLSTPMLGVVGPDGASVSTRPIHTLAPIDYESGPEMVFGPGNRLFTAWTEFQFHDRSKVMYSVGTPGGPFSPPVALHREKSEASLAAQQVTVDWTGNPTVAWYRGGVSCNAIPLRFKFQSRCKNVDPRVSVVTGDGNGGFGPVQTFRAFCSEPYLAAAPSGAAAIVMSCDRRNGQSRLMYSYRLPGGSFSRPVAISTARGDHWAPSVAISLEGRVFITWHHRLPGTPNRGETLRVEAVQALIGSPLSRPTALTKYRFYGGSTAGYLPYPDIDIALDGQAYLTWFHGRWHRLSIATLAPDLTLGAPVVIAPRNTDGAAIEIAANGRGYAVIDRYTRRGYVQQFLGFDLPR